MPSKPQTFCSYVTVHFSVRVGDGSRRSEDNNIELRLYNDYDDDDDENDDDDYIIIVAFVIFIIIIVIDR